MHTRIESSYQGYIWKFSLFLGCSGQHKVRERHAVARFALPNSGEHLHCSSHPVFDPGPESESDQVAEDRAGHHRLPKQREGVARE